jgi:hypothetical protein
MANTWQAAAARRRFPEILDAAGDGHAQFVKPPEGGLFMSDQCGAYFGAAVGE